MRGSSAATLAATLALLTASSRSVVTASSVPTTQFDAWGSDSVRVRIAGPGNGVVDPPIMGLLSAPPEGAWKENVSRRSTAGGVGETVTNGNLVASADPTTGLLTFTRASDGVVLLQQSSPVYFGPPPTNRTKVGSYSASITFNGVGEGETIVGFGSQQDGQVAKQLPFFRSIEASEYYPYNHGSQALVCMYMSSKGYVFLWNMPSYGFVNVTNDGITFFSNATLNIDFWVATTPTNFDSTTTSPFVPLLSHYADAVGHAPPMPYFATGFFQSKDRYFNQSQLLGVAREYVARGITISSIVIDWFHWNELGDWSFNPACWPDPQGMFDELQGMGIELMVTFWPFMNSSSVNWPVFNQRNWLATKESTGQHDMFWTYIQSGALVDTTNPYAQQAVFDHFWNSYGSLGVKAVWLDETEPDRAGYTYGEWELAAGTDYEVGAGWKKSWIQGMAQGFESKGLAKGEYFILSRSFWSGTQQYGNTVWSGDLFSTFDELQLQIAAGQGSGYTGQGMWTTDIGGYNSGNTSDPMFQELIVRWFQFAAFTPIFRLHGHRINGGETTICGTTNGDNEIWNLATDPAHYNAITSVMLLREDLRDYVSLINGEHSQTGMPLMRPMMMAFPADPACQGTDVEDQYMFGSDWLIGPVYTYQAESRTVYLPALSEGQGEWIYWWNQTVVSGGARVSIDTPIGEFPLFYRQVANATTATAKPAVEGAVLEEEGTEE